MTATSTSRRSSRRSWGQRLVILIPYLWLGAFFLVPFLIVFKISLSQYATAQPPYLPQLDLTEGLEGLREFFAGLSFTGYARLVSDSLYLTSYGRSLGIALVSTAILLLLGFPDRLRHGARAAALAGRAVHADRAAVLDVVPDPRLCLDDDPPARRTAQSGAARCFGIVDTPPVWISTDTAIFIGIVYTYLPFMVLPIYATLERMDETLLEAAADLGCPRWKAFWLVTVPLALPGVIAGSLLCFIPIVGEFVIPDLLGGSGAMMIGQTLWLEFFSNRDWPAASAVAVVLLALLIVPLVIYQHLQARRLERGG